MRKKGSRPSACLPARLLAWYWQRNFPREFTENCFAVFDQSSRVILLTWYCRLYFFPWIPRGYPLNGSVKDFLSNHRGVNIIQFRSISVSFSSMYFFLFQSLVRASENLSASWFFYQISCNKGLKAKISCFFMFFCLTPLGLECSRGRPLHSWRHIAWRNRKICIYKASRMEGKRGKCWKSSIFEGKLWVFISYLSVMKIVSMFYNSSLF